MNFKVKMVILAAVLLFGVTGVAFASGKLPGAVSDGLTSLKGSDTQGAGSVSSAADEQYGSDDQDLNDDAAGSQYGTDEDATEVEDHNSAADDEYKDNDAGEMDDHDPATGNNGVGLEHENEHGNVPATTPVPGGNAPSHGDEGESHRSAQGGASTSQRNDAGEHSSLGSGSGSGMGRQSSSTPPMEDRD